MRGFDFYPIDLEFVITGHGKQAAYHDGLKVASIHKTAEECYIVEFFVVGINTSEKFADDLETAQLVVWGAIAAHLSGTMFQSMCAAARAHVH